MNLIGSFTADYLLLCNELNATRPTIGHIPWFIIEQPRTTSRETCFLVFSVMALSFENVYAFILLFTKESRTKIFGEWSCLQWDKDVNKEPRRKIALIISKMPKLEQTFELSSASKQVFSCSLYKTDRFHVAVRLFSNRSQNWDRRRQNVVRTLVTHLAIATCSTHILT